VSANERREDILWILTTRGKEIARQLAHELGVTERTIRNDITLLTATYPIETIRGNGGGIKLQDGYNPNSFRLSREQEAAIIQAEDKVEEPHRKTLQNMLIAYRSPANYERR